MRVRHIDTPHVPHGWEARVLLRRDDGDLAVRRSVHALRRRPCRHRRRHRRAGRQAEDRVPIVEPCALHAATIDRLADLAPRTIALMHGSSFTGDGAAALRTRRQFVSPNAFRPRPERGDDVRCQLPRLHHIALTVTDVDASVRWYRARLRRSLPDGRAAPRRGRQGSRRRDVAAGDRAAPSRHQRRRALRRDDDRPRPRRLRARGSHRPRGLASPPRGQRRRPIRRRRQAARRSRRSPTSPTVRCSCSATPTTSSSSSS